jgi:hypothetical protein
MLIGRVVVNVQLYQVQEKDTQTKLETLFKKNLYSVAIDLAHSQQYDYNSITDIFRKYGDHLYSCATPFVLPFTLLLAPLFAVDARPCVIEGRATTTEPCASTCERLVDSSPPTSSASSSTPSAYTTSPPTSRYVRASV